LGGGPYFQFHGFGGEKVFANLHGDNTCPDFCKCGESTRYGVFFMKKQSPKQRPYNLSVKVPPYN